MHIVPLHWAFFICGEDSFSNFDDAVGLSVHSSSLGYHVDIFPLHWAFFVCGEDSFCHFDDVCNTMVSGPRPPSFFVYVFIGCPFVEGGRIRK